MFEPLMPVFHTPPGMDLGIDNYLDRAVNEVMGWRLDGRLFRSTAMALDASSSERDTTAILHRVLVCW